MTTRQWLILLSVMLVIAVIGAAFALGVGGLSGLGSGTPTATTTSSPEGLTATAKVIVVTATTQPATAATEAASATPTATTPPVTATTAPTTAPTEQPTAIVTPTTQAVIVKVGNTQQLGDFLVDSAGMTLYTYKNDTEGTSTCVDSCAVEWPPYTVAPGTQLTKGPGIPGELGTITRADGSLQVTYNGHPLYHSSKDKKPGDTIGQGDNNLWFVAALQ